MKKVTLQDIADKTGFSAGTVSRVLNGQAAKYRIKKETEEIISQIAKDLNFIQNKVFYKPQAILSRRIGLIVPDISHFFLGQLAKEIITEAKNAGIEVLLCDSMEDTQQAVRAIDHLLDSKIDGLIINPVGREKEHLEQLYHNGIPLVVVDRYIDNLECSAVFVDNYQGAFDVVTELIEQGHRRIACIQRLPDSWINNERLRGYRDAFKKYKISIDESLIIGNLYGQKNGYLEVKGLLGNSNPPTAIFALSHLVTLGTLKALHEEGVTVPDQMSIASFDDLPFTEYQNIQITTVQQPVIEMGSMALKLLVEQMNTRQKREPVHIKLPVTLVKRNSIRRIG